MLKIGDLIITAKNIKSYLNLSGNYFDEVIFKLTKDTIHEKNIKELINDNYTFQLIVASQDELDIFISFFALFKFRNNQSIKIRTLNTSVEEIDEVLNNYSNFKVSNHLLVNLDDRNEFVSYNILHNYVKYVKEFKKTISKKDSELEIITKAYNFVKQKAYKDNEKLPFLARSLSTASLTDNIVCVGYTKIFNNLLEEYDIKCLEYNFYHGENEEGHSVSVVNIDDLKYNIHGIYYFDPTNDSFKFDDEFNENKYKYFMMTNDEFHSIFDIKKDFFNNLLYNYDYLKEEYFPKMRESSKNYKADIIFDDKFSKTSIDISNAIYISNKLFKNADKILYSEMDLIEIKINIYYFIQEFKKNQGKEIDQKTFTDLMSNIYDDKKNILRSIASKFKGFENIDDNTKRLIL